MNTVLQVTSSKRLKNKFKKKAFHCVLERKKFQPGMWDERDQSVDKVLGVQYEGQSLDPQF